MLNSGKIVKCLKSGKRGLGIAGCGLIFAVIAYLATTADAYAYVDPNAAGLLFQILTPVLAVIAAGLAALRLWSVRWFGVVRSGFGWLSGRRTEGTLVTRRALLWRLWGSLVTIAVTFSVLDCLLFILPAADGWLAFLRPWEALFSVAWHLGLAVAEGCVLGTLAALLALPVLAIRSDRRRAQWVRGIIAAALVIGFLIFGILFLRQILQWMSTVGFADVSHRTRLTVVVVFVFAIGVAAIFRRSRKNMLRSFDTAFNGTVTRRALLATGVGVAAATLVDPRFGATKAPLPAAIPTHPNAQNIVLITFDALGAQHMSLYGSPLPTTPNIEAFAKKATTFTNFYSCSTFTTPSVATCLTGRYPSETQVYHVSGFLRGRSAERNLARELRAAGYFTAASVTNPFAHPDHLGIGEDFLLRPAPPLRGHPLSGALIRARDPLVSNYADTQEALLLRQIDRFAPIGSEWPPALSFEQGKRLLNEIGNKRPFFLWVHVLAPHATYKPAPPYLHRFLPDDQILRNQEMDGTNLTSNRYPADSQALVDRQRLRYAEFVAECDGAFGDFVTFLNASVGSETAVIVSADHGESFAGGVFTHGGPDQVRQIVNIPLIIRSPRHKAGDRVTIAADQTSLAPTILEFAGLPRPSWMRGPTLFPGDSETTRTGGEAFTQYLELNSIFEPIRQGTVGIIDGVNQFVVDLESRKGILRPLAEADLADADHSQENPALAAELLQRIYARFPGLADEIG